MSVTQVVPARSKAGAEGAYKVYGCSANHCVTHPSDGVDLVVTRKVIERAEQWRDVLPDVASQETSEMPDLGALRVEERSLISRKGELAEMFAEGQIDRATLSSGIERADSRLSAITDTIAQHSMSEFGFDINDIEALWVWSEDIDKFRPVIERVCRKIELFPRGKGNKQLRVDDHLRIEFFGG